MLNVFLSFYPLSVDRIDKCKQWRVCKGNKCNIVTELSTVLHLLKNIVLVNIPIRLLGKISLLC